MPFSYTPLPPVMPRGFWVPLLWLVGFLLIGLSSDAQAQAAPRKAQPAVTPARPQSAAATPTQSASTRPPEAIASPNASASPAPTSSAGATTTSPATAGSAVQPPIGTAGQSPAPSEEPLPHPIQLAPTEAELARGQPIARIDLVGSRRVTREDFLTYLRERVGQSFSPEALTRDVHELWDSGFFDDIQVDLDRSDQGIVLRFIVRERPNVRSIDYEGNSEIDNEKLGEAIEVKPNTILSYPALRRSTQKIRDAYAEKGYFLAEASFEVTPQRDNEVTVKFTIKEHEQVSVRRVTLIGNEHISDADLRDVMLTGQSSILSFGSGGPFRQDAFERDVLMINATYYDRGYLSVQVSTPRVMLTPDREGIEVALTINEGPQYRIRQLRIFERDANGREVEPIGGRRHLREMIRAKSGDVFNRAELAKDLQAVRTMYRDEGFANVEADPATDVDQKTQMVDIVVAIRRGPPVYFERIEVRGNTKTRDKVIRRELQIAEGQLFSETKLETSKRFVTALGYFERVDMSTEQGSAPERINVNIEVAERATGTFQVGAGFSSIENFILTAQVQQANLFGTGRSLALQAQVSGLRQLVDVRFFEPYFLDSKFSLAVDAYDQLYIYPSFSQQRLGGAITLGHPLTTPPYLRFSIAYSASEDKVSTTQTSTLFGLGTTSAIGVFQKLPLRNMFVDGFTSSIRPALTYDTRDNRLFPTNGVYLMASTELASSVLGSQLEFWRHRFTGRFYYPIGLGFVVKVNSETGLVTSPSSQGTPILARFFLGGILDVRGFYLRSIGPRLPLNGTLDPNSAPYPNGTPIGGNLMNYENFELEFPIVDKLGIRGVVFTDVGNTWNLEPIYCQAAPGAQNAVTDPCFHGISSLAAMRASYGAGIRWFSPLGPLRFEWGFPYAPLSYERHDDFQFTIGNFF